MTLRRAAQNVVDVWNRYGTAESLRGWMGILEAEVNKFDRCGKVTRDGDVHTCTSKALLLAQALHDRKDVYEEAAAELRRQHAEIERLGKLCYDYIGELTAMRAAKQMQDRIDKMKVAVAPVGLPAGESAAVAAAPARTLTDEVIADLWARNGTYHHHFARAIERWLKGEE